MSYRGKTCPHSKGAHHPGVMSLAEEMTTELGCEGGGILWGGLVFSVAKVVASISS